MVELYVKKIFHIYPSEISVFSWIDWYLTLITVDSSWILGFSGFGNLVLYLLRYGIVNSNGDVIWNEFSFFVS